MLPREFEETMEPDFSEKLQELVQEALNRKNTSDTDVARKWAIVRTELEKVLAYVRYIEEAR